ncbi:MAG TPA: TetR/AcrR family transcriptional regulator [Chthoniobacterales bacterium]|nr:TetR/AcrR family transcriptional regulator [Chthoniobacterales bacterium]
MPSRVREKLTKEQKRDRILETAGRLFRQYGFAKTTVADIAGELGMSPANVYKFFPAKDAIVEASANRNLALIREAVDAVARSKASAAARIEKIALTIFRFHQELFRNEQHIFQMVTQAVEESWQCIFDYEAYLCETLETMVTEGMAGGEFKRGQPGRLRLPLFDALYVALHPHLRHTWTPEEKEHRVRAHVAFVISALK